MPVNLASCNFSRLEPFWRACSWLMLINHWPPRSTAGRSPSMPFSTGEGASAGYLLNLASNFESCRLNFHPCPAACGLSMSVAKPSYVGTRSKQLQICSTSDGNLCIANLKADSCLLSDLDLIVLQTALCPAAHLNCRLFVWRKLPSRTWGKKLCVCVCVDGIMQMRQQNQGRAHTHDLFLKVLNLFSLLQVRTEQSPMSPFRFLLYCVLSFKA